MNQLDIVYPQYIESDDPTGNIVIQAAWNKERNKLSLLLANYDSKDLECKVDLKELGVKFKRTSKTYEIAPGAVSVFNTSENPDRVKIAYGESKVSNNIKVRLKHNSVFAYELVVE